jgi:O-antigen/teichoic acid export membrane protein
MKGVMIGACVNIALNLMLIPMFGMIGAAVATSIGVVTLNVINVAQLAGGSGIDSTVLGFIGTKKAAA